MTNVIVVLTDQFRYDCVGVNGSPVARTPRIDQFANEGVRFTHAFTPTGICSPARTSMLTGQYPHRHGVMNNVSGPDAIAADIPPGAPLLPELLQDAGYRTGYVGKYHVAAHEAPKRHGFTDAVGTGFFWADDEFLDYRRRLGHPVTKESPAFPISRWTTAGTPLLGKEDVPIEATPPGYLVQRATDLLDDYADAGSPFFLVLSFVGPHWPHVLPEPYWSMYDPADLEPWPSFFDDMAGKPGAGAKTKIRFGVEGWTWEDWAPVVATYFGSVTFHDHLIGQFLDAVADRGLDDTTLVAVTADHGDMTGSHGQFNKGPMMYDDVYRIPLFVRAPGRAAAQAGTSQSGAVRHQFVSNMDLMPTALAAAGIVAPNDMDARDLTPLLTGAGRFAERDGFFAQFHGDEGGLYSQRMLRTERYKLVYNAHDTDELYDMAEDPWEMRNLANDPAHAAVRRGLQARLFAWMQDTNDPMAGACRHFMSSPRARSVPLAQR
jgi:arylsulfatase A-like enzyme